MTIDNALDVLVRYLLLLPSVLDVKPTRALSSPFLSSWTWLRSLDHVTSVLAWIWVKLIICSFDYNDETIRSI